jgi:hypothetical protein
VDRRGDSARSEARVVPEGEKGPEVIQPSDVAFLSLTRLHAS